jgi:Holliday junction resolvase RusA-like endonuclease
VIRWEGLIVTDNNRLGARSYKNKAIIYQTNVYRAFKTNLTLWFVINFKEIFGDDYVDIEITVGMWKMKDTSNCLKPVFDALEDARIINNDRFIRNIKITRKYVKRGELDYLELNINRVKEEEC